MKRNFYRLLTVAAILLLLVTSSASAADKVVIIPLGKTVHDANLIPENIKYNTEILGVLGTYPDPLCMSTAETYCETWCISYYVIPAEYVPCIQGCMTMKLLYEATCLQ